MKKKILTIKKIMEHITYDVTNICYENVAKPIFRVSESGITYKKYQLIQNGEQVSTVLTKLCNDSSFLNVQCYDENDKPISMINPRTDNTGIKHYSIDISYWDKHDKIKICYVDAGNDKYEKYYTKKEFCCNIPKYDYETIEVVKVMDDILKDTNLLFVETDNDFIAVEAKELHKFLASLK